jgi:hypothetical protein
MSTRDASRSSRSRTILRGARSMMCPSVIDDVRIGDLKHDNLGYLNGRAVWIDYDMQGV